ncbi:Nn.00g066360.m01.CDS01 [Neocucurbitaria sp. VM-36]
MSELSNNVEFQRSSKEEDAKREKHENEADFSEHEPFLANSEYDTVFRALSTLFLGAGNYCMQVLVAPSRAEVDKAHREGYSLDVGIHSFGNVWRISPKRRAAWFVLGVISTLMHLFWNSAIFSSIPFTVFPAAIVTSDFERVRDKWEFSHPMSDSTILANASSIYGLQDKARNFTQLTTRECIEAYIDPRKATSELVLVSSIRTKQNVRNGTESSLLDGWISGSDHARWDTATNWICSALYEDSTWPQACTKEWVMPSANSWVVRGQPIRYCLVGKSADNNIRCGLHFSKTIFIVIATCLLIEALLICWVTSLSKSATMVTLGDAQAEFLERPDQQTEGTWEPGRSSNRRHFARLQIAEWRPTRLFWYNAVGPKMWIITVTLIVAALILGIILFDMSLKAMRHRGLGTSLPNLWGYGIGRTNAFALVGGVVLGNRGTQDFVGHVLFVNIFQVMISALYLYYNNCLTCQVVADQWTHFMTASNGVPDRKPLRVSSHVGLQRTSYMLSLPWTYASPLMLAFVVLHTLVARSCFLVRTTAYGPGSVEQSQRIISSDASRVGYSSMGILLATSTGAVILLLLIVNSFRRYPAVPEHLPRLANKTAFISAACQRPEGDTEAHIFAVALMAVDAEPDSISGTEPIVKRVVLSTDRNSVTPKVGERYLQPMPIDKHDEWKWIKDGLRWGMRISFYVVTKLRR